MSRYLIQTQYPILQTKWNLTLDIPRLLFIMPIGSNTRAHINKRHATTVFHMSKGALKACFLPKKTRYFICEHGKTKTVKRQPMCQYQEAYLLVKYLNQMKQLLKKGEQQRKGERFIRHEHKTEIRE
jgi:hypothetical protein